MNKLKQALLSLFVCTSLSGFAQASMSVGFEEVRVPNAGETPLVVGVWYPTKAPAAKQSLEAFTQFVALGAPVVGCHLPLVVISHGGGGSFAAHYDTALALVQAGFVVAALSHTGDTYDDQSQVLKLWRRPAQLKLLVSYMLSDWRGHERIEPTRIGAFGFSNGGFTVLVAAGGLPDLRKIDPYCVDHPDHDLCQALKQADVISTSSFVPPVSAWVSDPRIKAIVAAAPAFGFAFDRVGLKDVHVPVQLWRAEDDRHQPNPYYDENVRAALPHVTEFQLVPGAGHYDFLAPCSPTLAMRVPAICTERNGFDRAKFHAMFNAEIVRFFKVNLP